MLKFVYEVEKCENKELLEKMAAVRTAEDFFDLMAEYSEDECIDAFAAVNGECINMDFVNECIADCEDIWQASLIIINMIEEAIENKYSNEE